ncbi:hypothetical protein ACFX2J_009047 [Malus domestica]
MKMEVQSFLNDIVCYYRDAKYDAFGLFPYVFDSSHNGARTLVFDALITAFAAYSMLENAVDVSVQTKNMQLEPHIWSCNFLLKCLAEANILESVRILFECLKKYGPSPNVYTYTIMMNFYCQGHEGKGVDIGEATNILQEMEKRGKHPTVVGCLGRHFTVYTYHGKVKWTVSKGEATLDCGHRMALKLLLENVSYWSGSILGFDTGSNTGGSWRPE